MNRQNWCHVRTSSRTRSSDISFSHWDAETERRNAETERRDAETKRRDAETERRDAETENLSSSLVRFTWFPSDIIRWLLTESAEWLVLHPVSYTLSPRGEQSCRTSQLHAVERDSTYTEPIPVPLSLTDWQGNSHRRHSDVKTQRNKTDPSQQVSRN